MESEFINRSRLFREAFLPGAYARLRNQAYAKIVGIRNSNSALDGVDKEQLVDAVATFLVDWEAVGGLVEAGFRVAAQQKRLEIQSPSELYVTPAPTMLTCKTCSVIDFYDTRTPGDQVLQKMKGRVRARHGRSVVICKRPGCGGAMVQIPYLAVHRCGFSSNLYVHHSARRAQNIGFKSTGSFFNSSYFDVDTGAKLAGTLQDECSGCATKYGQSGGPSGPPTEELNKRGTPLTNGESFYAQSTQYIALSVERGRLVSEMLGSIAQSQGVLAGLTVDIAEGVAATLIRNVSGRELEEQLIASLSGSFADATKHAELSGQIARKRAAVDRYRALAESDEFMREMLESTEREIAELDRQLTSAAGKFRAVRSDLPEDETLLQLVKHRRSLEAVLLDRDVSGVTVEQAIGQSGDLVQKEAMEAQWSAVKERYGVESISHIPDLKVVLASLGYTREKRIPSNNPAAARVVLNGYEDLNDDAMRGKTPVYAMSAKTEALWIRLDPQKVLSWCISSAGWQDPGDAVKACRKRSHAHLLKQSPALSMHPKMVGSETMGQPKGESAPFHLLHTISHALMLTARRHTGYDSKSIMEYLFPMDLSVILYVSSVQNFTAGGLLTLFQHHLLPWFDDASLFAFNCAFDPVCSDSGGSCSGCVQLELACETFNQGLSRAYIHGGNVDRELSLEVSEGFWDARS